MLCKIMRSRGRDGASCSWSPSGETSLSGTCGSVLVGAKTGCGEDVASLVSAGPGAFCGEDGADRVSRTFSFEIAGLAREFCFVVCKEIV